MNRTATRFYDFGPFRVDTADYRLFRKGVEVPLPPKVFETLLVLLEKRGQLVGKDELMKRLWPGMFVGDDSLAQKVSLLRKALDDGNGSKGYISTVPKLGYRFTGDVACPDPGIVENDGVHDFRAGSAALHGAKIVVRKQTHWVIAGVALGILLCGLGILWLEMHRAPATAAVNYRLSKLDVSNEVAGAVISPDGNQLAYVGFDHGKYSLWVRPIASAGKGLQVVSPMAGRIRAVNYSADEAYLYYVVNLTTPDRGVLFRVNSLGGPSQRLLDGIDERVQCEPDGPRIVYKRFIYSTQGDVVGSELVVARVDGTDPRPVARSDGANSEFYGYYWSQEGNIVFSERVQESGKTNWYLAEVSPNGGAETPISQFSLNNIYSIVPLGRSEIGAVARDPQSGLGQVWVLNRNGNVRRVTNDTSRYIYISGAVNSHRMLASRMETEDSLWLATASQTPGERTETLDAHELKLPRDLYDNPVFTPDGNIVYTSPSVPRKRDLWWVRSDGSGQKRLTSNGAFNNDEAISPDGKYVVFVLRREGASRIWRMDIDGSNPLQLTADSDDESPQFSPDGKWVVYNSIDAGLWSIWKVPTGGGTAFKIADSVRTFGPVSLLISPDGKWIASQRLSPVVDQQRWGIFSFQDGTLLKDIDLPKNSLVSWSRDGKSLIYVPQPGETQALWSQPITGQALKMIMNLGLSDVYSIDWSKDGKKIVLLRRIVRNDLVLIDETH